MGEVYRARDTRLDRTGRDQDSAATLARTSISRFAREAKAIAALSHPHICTLFDIGREAQAPDYLVMECLEGETLAGSPEARSAAARPGAEDGDRDRRRARHGAPRRHRASRL